jgi:hypothetical protein
VEHPATRDSDSQFFDRCDFSLLAWMQSRIFIVLCALSASVEAER